MSSFGYIQFMFKLHDHCDAVEHLHREKRVDEIIETPVSVRQSNENIFKMKLEHYATITNTRHLFYLSVLTLNLSVFTFSLNTLMWLS